MCPFNFQELTKYYFMRSCLLISKKKKKIYKLYNGSLEFAGVKFRERYTFRRVSLMRSSKPCNIVLKCLQGKKRLLLEFTFSDLARQTNWGKTTSNLEWFMDSSWPKWIQDLQGEVNFKGLILRMYSVSDSCQIFAVWCVLSPFQRNIHHPKGKTVTLKCFVDVCIARPSLFRSLCKFIT